MEPQDFTRLTQDDTKCHTERSEVSQTQILPPHIDYVRVRMTFLVKICVICGYKYRENLI